MITELSIISFLLFKQINNLYKYININIIYIFLLIKNSSITHFQYTENNNTKLY